MAPPKGAAQAQQPAGRTLPSREAQMYRNMISLYEDKKYKKALKVADQILKKHPNHGETLSMKGLILSYIPARKGEAYETAKKGVKFDVTSHVCWHVLGLLYRNNKEHAEALKYFHFALMKDPENIQIMRDLSTLQIHLRQLEGFRDTRRKMLLVRGGPKLHWLTYAAALHLTGDFESAAELLHMTQKHFDRWDIKEDPYGQSELILYTAMVYEEAGRLQEALDFLKQNQSKVTDTVTYLETVARLDLYLGNRQEANSEYRTLLSMLPNNEAYLVCLISSHPTLCSICPPPPPPVKIIPPEKTAEECALENGSSEHTDNNGSSSLPVGARLHIFPPTVHPRGRSGFGWLRPPVEAVQPPVSGDEATRFPKRPLSGMYRRKRARMLWLGDLPQLSDEEEKAMMAFCSELAKDIPSSDAIRRLPLYFLNGDAFARGFDEFARRLLRKGAPAFYVIAKAFGQTEEKKAIITRTLEGYVKCLSQTPATFGPKPEATESGDPEPDGEGPSCLLFTYLALAHHYDGLGQVELALETIEKALNHTPTLAEAWTAKSRFLKHAGDLRGASESMKEAKDLDQADRCVSTLAVKAMLRVDELKEAEAAALVFSRQSEIDGLHDMQHMWYELATARSSMRCGEYGKALRQLRKIFTHFDDILEDQYDFHLYCTRRAAFRTYVQFLRTEDKLYCHKQFRDAAIETVKLYLDIHRGKIVPTKPDDAADGQSKKKRNPKPDSATSPANTKTQPLGRDGKPRPIDTDPDGVELLASVKPLEEAATLAEKLRTYSSMDVLSNATAFEVYRELKKPMAMLQCLARIYELVGRRRVERRLSVALTIFLKEADIDALPEVARTIVIQSVSRMLDIKDESVKNNEELRTAARNYVEEVVLPAAMASQQTEDVHCACVCLREIGMPWTAEKAVSILKTANSSVANSGLLECHSFLHWLLRQKEEVKTEEEKTRVVTATEDFRAAAEQRFPRATAFAPSEEEEQEMRVIFVELDD